jgi:lysyl oxidase
MPMTRMAARLFFLAVVFTVFGICLAAPTADAQVVPCADPRGCPDLIVDASKLAQTFIDKATFASTDCAVIEGEVEAGTRKLLRFNFSTPNLGPGDLFIGSPWPHIAANDGWFIYPTCHGHPHFAQYADYRLWTVDGYTAWKALRDANPGALASDLLAANPNLAAQMIVGRKFGFCVIDVIQYSTTALAKYTSCFDNQGISVGWADLYGYRLDGQWIDITDVPGGTYVLEGEVNAEHFFTEADYSNNSATTVVKLPGKKGR